ncbi:MAG: mandelate racemase/muconate lactonizing enzyme family protein [Devosia nanyangense]|uniref:Mandelate racemase/muconate lactonizing enzyme family protein n=1 Tax=Devosia nanyangense TaxID=1228055 RepID=A0A933L266_9HYPH|nr:mandelate racemase/muconate lactonizing enzyme family protein [Devosia nanyangense]
MRIESVDFFYLSMPEITLEADGSQDALLVRATGGGFEGWGECEASPLVSIAAFVTPRSHGVCQPVAASVLGQTLDEPADIRRIAALVERNSMDLLQAAHTFSGVEMALWDLLGKARGEPVWKLLGYDRAYGKSPYASLLFGDTAQETLEAGKAAVARGFRAIKFGWAGFGEGSVDRDAEHLHAAREGLGPDGHLLVDAGQIWVEDVEAAAARIPALEAVRATWLEEPFQASAYGAYGQLAKRSGTVKLAGGEGAHNVHMAKHLIDFGGVGFIQIDCGRIGGIAAAKAVADYAVGQGVAYVNHTFTSHLALSASLQPFAGLRDSRICEYPAAPKALAVDITREHLLPDGNGEVHVPDAPGLGMTVDLDRLKPYQRSVEIRVADQLLYSSPVIS